jgi:hypothetical protein
MSGGQGILAVGSNALEAASAMADPMGGLGFDAGKAFGDGMKAGAADALEQHSPSRVMQRMGKQSAESFVSGADNVDAWAPQAGMSPPQLGASAEGGGNSVTVDVGGIHVSGSSPEQIVSLLESQVTDIFERVALELGQ